MLSPIIIYICNKEFNLVKKRQDFVCKKSIYKKQGRAPSLFRDSFFCEKDRVIFKNV